MTPLLNQSYNNLHLEMHLNNPNNLFEQLHTQSFTFYNFNFIFGQKTQMESHLKGGLAFLSGIDKDLHFLKILSKLSFVF